jgi:hypothetical protein
MFMAGKKEMPRRLKNGKKKVTISSYLSLQ